MYLMESKTPVYMRDLEAMTLTSVQAFTVSVYER
jgi:hypothetical protein